ncbi:MAG: RDD family protein, partial [Candidatus Promineifilaceae bacterium]
TGGVLTRVSLGSALLAVDALNERLEQVEETEALRDPQPRTLDSVLAPEAEWGERFGQAPGMAARHLTIGVLIDTRSKVSRGLDFLNGVGNATVRALEFVFDPITHSRPFRPVRKRYQSAVERGENQVNYWMNLGRAEDVRSRDLAETALTQVVDESMDELVDNERIQEFVQEMLTAQSFGIIDEAIEEIRERAVSSDTFFEQPFRRLLRRSPRRSIPGPDIDRRLVRPVSKRNILLDDGSLLGYYAGFTSRLLAFAIDVVLVIVFIAMTGWVFQTILRLLGDSPRLDSLALTGDMVAAAGVILGSLNAVTVVIAYAFVFWIMTGQTPGMMLMGLRVVARNGEHLSFWRALRRLLGYIVSILFLFLGFAWVLIDDRRQGWHDKIADTYVVYAWDAHPDETFLSPRMRIGD